MRCVQTFGLYCMSALNIQRLNHLCPLFLQKQLKLSKYCIEIICEHQFSSYVKDTQLDLSIDYDRAIQTQNKISPKYFSVTLMGSLESSYWKVSLYPSLKSLQPLIGFIAVLFQLYRCSIFLSTLTSFLGKSSHSMSLPPTHLILFEKDFAKHASFSIHSSLIHIYVLVCHIQSQ
ncbi:hypothetical protein ATANTOWER_016503 [Ataeniobius toweri]|uniref:Uncharacterized protein n=1 Tax=Ataeniobius toweri TaxID=208326 RepID=A0ABU7BQ18_9TELE|nr:hypothetical protein [Ataeniobius toweri]